MEILLGVLIGFLLSELICFLVTIVTGSEEKGVVSGCFIFFILFVCISKLFKTLRVAYIRKHYVAFALCGCCKNKLYKEDELRVFRIKPKNIGKYRNKFDAFVDAFIDESGDCTVYYYFKEINMKHVENVRSVEDKRNRNDKFNYKWIKENMLR